MLSGLRGSRMLLLFAAVLGVSGSATPTWLADAVARPNRSATYRALDADRKPIDVLKFAGLQRGMRVLDVGTGGGYYTEILADAVGPEGAVVGWNTPAFARRASVASALGKVRARYPNVTYFATPTTTMALPRATFDLVMLHLMFHDFYWESAEFGFDRVDPKDVASELFAATKPGGTVIVADHVAETGREPRAEVERAHRIDPAVVRAAFEAAGFKFDEESNLLRRVDDDHSKRVFDPTIRGKTDRFLFRFRKPAGGNK